MTGQLPLFNESMKEPHPRDPGEQLLEPIILNKDQTYSAAALVPADAQFRITNNYEVSGSLLGRLLRALNEKTNSGSPVTREELASELTIPKERLAGLFYIVRKAEMISAKNKLTPYGTVVLNSDPYLFNIGSLWFLHYLMASNARLIIWSRLFNSVFYQKDEISPSNITEFFIDAKAGMSNKQFEHNGGKELGAILRTYSDQLFKPLGLIIRVDLGHYAIITDEFPIPPWIWLASILTYRERYYPGAATLETHLLVDAHFSPGRLFRQNEKSVRRALDGLHNRGLIAVERSLGLDQIRFKSGITWLTSVSRYFQEGR